MAAETNADDLQGQILLRHPERGDEITMHLPMDARFAGHLLMWLASEGFAIVLREGVTAPIPGS